MASRPRHCLLPLQYVTFSGWCPMGMGMGMAIPIRLPFDSCVCEGIASRAVCEPANRFLSPQQKSSLVAM